METNYEILKDWVNHNQGILAIILFLASGIIAWLSGALKWIWERFNKKTTPRIIIGGDNLSGGVDIIFGNKTFTQKSGKNSTNIQGKNIKINNYDK